jgi:hypothetical protein
MSVPPKMLKTPIGVVLQTPIQESFFCCHWLSVV